MLDLGSSLSALAFLAMEFRTPPSASSVRDALEAAAASPLPPDDNDDADGAILHLQTLAEDLLRQVAEREVELEEANERHEAELHAVGTRAPWADPPWLRRQPSWLQALAFATILSAVVLLPRH